MDTSVTEPDPTGQDTGAMTKGKDRNESNAVVSSSPMASKELENIVSKASSEAGMDPPAASPSSASTSRTSIPPHLVSETPNAPSTVRPRSRPVSRDTSPYPRSRPSTPSTPTAMSSGRPVAPRRSARTLAKGPERPRGPPELEAALTIAIRNLESDIYEWWCANQKPGSPIPTTAYLKGRSPRIRKAAEAVDEADRLLNEAVYGKARKGRSAPTKKSQGKPEPQVPPGADPEKTFGHGQFNPHRNSPL